MILRRPGAALEPGTLPDPVAGPGEALLRVLACGVCRTDLHVLDGELPRPKLPLVLGHQIVGEVLTSSGRFPVGARVGVPWVGWTCGECAFCARGEENLCDAARFTGYDLDGGYAELCVADERFCFPIPEGYPNDQAAPLLCAGLIGFRALRLAGPNVDRLGLVGFGAAAHIVSQVAADEGREVVALTRPGDESTQAFALSLGASWAGGTDESPPPLDAAIVFAPAGELVPRSLELVRKGGVVVCAGIHMSDIPSFPYDLLWGERHIRSVANLTRRDGEEFLALAPTIPVRTAVETLPLSRANEALARLRAGAVEGALVLVP